MHTFTSIFLSVLAASALVRLWLTHRQIRHIRAHHARVPDAFADRIPLEDHQRAADYSCSKLRTGRLMLATAARGHGDGDGEARGEPREGHAMESKSATDHLASPDDQGRYQIGEVQARSWITGSWSS